MSRDIREYTNIETDLSNANLVVEMPALSGDLWENQKDIWGEILNNRVFNPIVSQLGKFKVILGKILSKTKELQEDYNTNGVKHTSGYKNTSTTNGDYIRLGTDGILNIPNRWKVYNGNTVAGELDISDNRWKIKTTGRSNNTFKYIADEDDVTRLDNKIDNDVLKKAHSYINFGNNSKVITTDGTNTTVSNSIKFNNNASLSYKASDKSLEYSTIGSDATTSKVITSNDYYFHNSTQTKTNKILSVFNGQNSTGGQMDYTHLPQTISFYKDNSIMGYLNVSNDRDGLLLSLKNVDNFAAYRVLTMKDLDDYKDSISLYSLNNTSFIRNNFVAGDKVVRLNKENNDFIAEIGKGINFYDGASTNIDKIYSLTFNSTNKGIEVQGFGSYARDKSLLLDSSDVKLVNTPDFDRVTEYIPRIKINSNNTSNMDIGNSITFYNNSLRSVGQNKEKLRGDSGNTLKVNSSNDLVYNDNKIVTASGGNFNQTNISFNSLSLNSDLTFRGNAFNLKSSNNKNVLNYSSSDETVIIGDSSNTNKIKFYSADKPIYIGRDNTEKPLLTQEDLDNHTYNFAIGNIPRANGSKYGMISEDKVRELVPVYRENTTSNSRDKTTNRSSFLKVDNNSLRIPKKIISYDDSESGTLYDIPKGSLGFENTHMKYYQGRSSEGKKVLVEGDAIGSTNRQEFPTVDLKIKKLELINTQNNIVLPDFPTENIDGWGSGIRLGGGKCFISHYYRNNQKQLLIGNHNYHDLIYMYSKEKPVWNFKSNPILVKEDAKIWIDSIKLGSYEHSGSSNISLDQPLINFDYVTFVMQQTNNNSYKNSHYYIARHTREELLTTYKFYDRYKQSGYYPEFTGPQYRAGDNYYHFRLNEIMNNTIRFNAAGGRLLEIWGHNYVIQKDKPSGRLEIE